MVIMLSDRCPSPAIPAPLVVVAVVRVPSRQGGLVPDLAGKVIIQVACGSYHTISLDEDGRVYPFGRYFISTTIIGELFLCLLSRFEASSSSEVGVSIGTEGWTELCLLRDTSRNSRRLLLLLLLLFATLDDPKVSQTSTLHAPSTTFKGCG